MENKLEKIGQNSFMDNFVKTDDILNDMCGIIESSQKLHIRRLILHLFKGTGFQDTELRKKNLADRNVLNMGFRLSRKAIMKKRELERFLESDPEMFSLEAEIYHYIEILSNI